MDTLIILDEDERATIHRALSTRLEAVRNEYAITISRPNPTPQHSEAARILKREIDSIAKTSRILWAAASTNRSPP